MAYTTINKSTDYFGTLLYTGNNTNDRDITGLNFTPSLTWIKSRDYAGNHGLFDAVRGADKSIRANDTRVEDTSPSNKDLDSFISGGIRVDQSNYIDTNSDGISTVAWNWKANGQGSSNTDGSINTTYTSVNTTAGFSICKWTGTGSAGTIGHGLGAVPKMIIIKDLSNTRDWFVYHASVGNNKRLKLNDTVAEGASTVFNSTTPTSSVFSIDGSVYVNNSGSNYIAYCFADVVGYSKFGSYTGNGNADGSFIYTSFKPAFVIIKRTDSGSSAGWLMFDNKRLGYNGGNSFLEPSGNATESSAERIDILSQGFKNRSTTQVNNASGGTYIYMAFGQSLVGSNNVPCTAR